MSTEDRTARTIISYIPNALGFLRVLLLLPILLMLEAGIMPAAVTIFFLALVTDLLDGPIARRFHAGTPYGWLVDTTSDAILTIVLISYFSMVQEASLWLSLFLILSYLLFIITSLKGKMVYDPFGRWIGIFAYIILIMYFFSVPPVVISISRYLLTVFIPLAIIGRIVLIRRAFGADTE